MWQWLGGQRSTPLEHALSQSAQTTPWLRCTALAVVDDLDDCGAVFLEDPDSAAFGLAVAHHVGYPLADRPGEHGLNRRRQGHVLAFGPQFDPGGGQGVASTGHLGVERRLTIAGHRLADFPKGIPSYLLDIFNLMGGQSGAGLDQPASELAF